MGSAIQRTLASITPSPTVARAMSTRGSSWILALSARSALVSASVTDEVGDRAAPQHVVEGDQPARSHQLQRALVVVVVVGLVGVDEGEVERALAGRDHRVERIDAGAQAQVDLVVDAGLAPIGPRLVGELLADIERDDAAVRPAAPGRR